MAVRILIQRRVKAGKENEIGEAIRNIVPKVVQARGFISGETLRSVDDPSLRVVISAWKSVEDWQLWLDTPERKAFARKIAGLLAEAETISAYQTDTYFDVKGIVETLVEETVGAD